MAIVGACVLVVKYLGRGFHCHLMKLDPGIPDALPCVGEPCRTDGYVASADCMLP